MINIPNRVVLVISKYGLYIPFMVAIVSYACLYSNWSKRPKDNYLSDEKRFIVSRYILFIISIGYGMAALFYLGPFFKSGDFKYDMFFFYFGTCFLLLFMYCHYLSRSSYVLITEDFFEIKIGRKIRRVKREDIVDVAYGGNHYAISTKRKKAEIVFYNIFYQGHMIYHLL